jgi:hypothetical protein
LNMVNNFLPRVGCPQITVVQMFPPAQRGGLRRSWRSPHRAFSGIRRVPADGASSPQGDQPSIFLPSAPPMSLYRRGFHMLNTAVVPHHPCERR